jgi:iron only hydrogenase large subunit-like protein
LRSYNINNEIYINQDFSKKEDYINNQSAAIVIDASKCVLCGRCIGACKKYTGHGVLDYNFRGFKTFVGPALNHDMEDAGCIYCGKCIQACPTGALSEKEQIDEVDEILSAKDKFVVAEVAPAIRTALGEEFGLPVGTNVEAQLFRALKDLGFDDITDTSFAADLTVTEEGDEFLKRLTDHLDGKGAALPMFTSCSPGWIRYI